jgi:hypothetical protein
MTDDNNGLEQVVKTNQSSTLPVSHWKKAKAFMKEAKPLLDALQELAEKHGATFEGPGTLANLVKISQFPSRVLHSGGQTSRVVPRHTRTTFTIRFYSHVPFDCPVKYIRAAENQKSITRKIKDLEHCHNIARTCRAHLGEKIDINTEANWSRQIKELESSLEYSQIILQTQWDGPPIIT